MEVVETAPALGLLLSVKDSQEVELIRRAAILTNKVRYCVNRGGEEGGGRCHRMTVLTWPWWSKPYAMMCDARRCDAVLVR